MTGTRRYAGNTATASAAGRVPAIDEQHAARFKPLPLIVTVLVLLLLIGQLAIWYGRQVSVPRYCDDRQATLLRLREVLTEERPAGDGARRQHLIAAKLLFLVPRRSGEALDDYLGRVEVTVENQCR